MGIGLFNALFSGANADPSLPVAFVLGPFHVTWAALAGASGSRRASSPSRRSGWCSPRPPTRPGSSTRSCSRAGSRSASAYGALAAYQAVPRLADQVTTLRQARRIRGLRWSWHPRLLVGLLVLAIRHGDRLALAMDARAFGSGPRSRYRVVRWTWLDLAVPIGALLVLVVALRLG